MVIKVQDILGKLLHSSQGRAITAELEEERLSRRQEVVNEIQAIRDKADAEMPKRQKVIKTAREKYEVSEQALLDARTELAQAHRSATAGNNEANRRIGQLEAELQSTADQETINAFRDGMDGLLGKLRNFEYSSAPETQRMIDGPSRLKAGGNPGNRVEVSACISQVVEIRREATNIVVLEPLDGPALTARLDQLWQRIDLPKR